MTTARNTLPCLAVMAVAIVLSGCTNRGVSNETGVHSTKTKDPPPIATEIGTLAGHKDAVSALAYTPDGRYIVSAGYGDFSVRLWDPLTLRLIQSIRTENRIRCLAVSSITNAFVTGDVYGKLGFWAIVNGRLVQSAEIANGPGPIHAIALSRNGAILAVGSFDRIVSIWDMRTRTLRGRMTTEPGAASAVALSPDGKLLATAGEGSWFTIWDSTWTKRRVLVVSKVNAKSTITALAFSANGKYFATAHNESTHSIWNTRDWRETYNTYVTDASTMAATFSADGRYLATAQYGTGVHLWEPGSGRQAGVIREFKKPFESLAFSPDGRTLATGGQDRTIRFWRLLSKPRVIAGNSDAGSSRLRP